MSVCSERVAYIMRGLPGAGKSTLARRLAEPDGVVVSADDWHVGEDGVYRYDASRAGEAHLWCQMRFRDALLAGISPVVVDNTNVTHEQMRPYVEFADLHGYRVVPVTVWPFMMTDEEFAARTVHAVPAEAIARKRAQWEW